MSAVAFIFEHDGQVYGRGAEYRGKEDAPLVARNLVRTFELVVERALLRERDGNRRPEAPLPTPLPSLNVKLCTSQASIFPDDNPRAIYRFDQATSMVWHASRMARWLRFTDEARAEFERKVHDVILVTTDDDIRNPAAAASDPAPATTLGDDMTG